MACDLVMQTTVGNREIGWRYRSMRALLFWLGSSGGGSSAGFPAALPPASYDELIHGTGT
ncbi:hypothetical protein ACTGJ9_001425 [Bradyrhizobium sp. RDM12]